MKERRGKEEERRQDEGSTSGRKLEVRSGFSHLEKSLHSKESS